MAGGSHKTLRFFVLCTATFVISTTSLFGFGEFGGGISLPGFSPYGLTYVPSAQLLIACQFEDGQAVRYEITSPNEVGPLQIMFSPITDGRAAGLAWHPEEEVLYWLNMLGEEGSGAETYRLLRSTVDGFALQAGPELQISPGRTLGDIAFVPELGAIVTVDAENEVYLGFDPITGELLDFTIPAPVGHPETGFAYGLGLDHVPLDNGYLDLLTGLLVELRAMRVERVGLDGTTFGVSYAIDIPSDAARPVWPVGLAYCLGTGGHFTAIADRLGDKILLFNTPSPLAPGVTNVTASVEDKEIGAGQDTERITVNFSWENNGSYDTVLIEYLDAMTDEFVVAVQVPGGTNQASHDINREGAFLYRLTPSIGGVSVPATRIGVSTGGGEQLAKGTTRSDSEASSPFATTLVEGEDEPELYVAEIRIRAGEMNPVAHRFTWGNPGELVKAGTTSSPFPQNVLTVALAWREPSNELVWLGNLLDDHGVPLNKYLIARTTTAGVPTDQISTLAVNPFPRSTLGDMAYDSAADVFWILSRETQTLWALDLDTGLPTGDRVMLPVTLPGEKGTWGLSQGIAVVPGAEEGTSIFVATMGRIAAVPEAPALGLGFPKHLVSFVRQGESGSLVIGQAVDLELSTGSARVGGIAVRTGSNPTALVVCQDVAWLYEVRLRGSGPLFSRGDANADRGIDVADAVFTLEYLFSGGPEPSCLDTADANDTGFINLADALYMLRHVFGLLGDQFRPAPFGLCGTDPTADGLSCSGYAPCAGGE